MSKATVKLTTLQRRALHWLAVEPGSAYGMQISLGTLDALSDRGLASPVGHGHMAFPRNGTWKITEAGRAAIA